ncbi:MAG: tol-pal system protein YbgF [Deltaproteobacteria bacterium]|nr:tol-pal system protein YbgF [Deltaproteobacteria bacterium]
MFETFRVPLVFVRLPLRRAAAGAAFVALSLVGCAGAPSPSGETTPVEEARDMEAERQAREREAEHQARLRELEAQLALARAEAAELRANSGAQVQTDTVRIGGEDASDNASLFDDTDTGEWEVPAEHLPPEDDDPGPSARNRPVLRLYGERPEEPVPLGDPSFAAMAGATPLPVAPLPVVDPSLRMATAPAPVGDSGAPPWITAAPPSATPAERPTVDSGREAYERALGLFRERKVAEAARELRRMLSSYPGHTLASRARYWLAESLYIQRRYDDARRTFEDYVQGAPGAAKVPDALLKIGLCHQRSGNDAAASRVFARLRSEHPNSVAARTAAGSGS